MYDPYDSRTQRARELLTSVLFLALSGILVVVVAYYIMDDQAQKSPVINQQQVELRARFEPGEIGTIMTPDATDCFVYALRDDLVKHTAGARGFMLPPGIRIRVLLQDRDSIANIEVLKGKHTGSKGYVKASDLSR